MSSYSFEDTGLDPNNPRAVNYYKKCSETADTLDKFNDLFIVHPLYYIFIYSSLLYIIITTIVLFFIKKKHIMNSNYFKLSLLFIIGYIFIIINAFQIDVYYKTSACFVSLLLTGLGYPYVLFSCVCFSTQWINKYHASSELMLKNLTKSRNKTLFQKLFSKITKVKMFFTIFIYTILICCYTVIVSFINSNYKIYPPSVGFCPYNIYYLPQTVSLISYFLIYTPITLLELRSIKATNSMKKSQLISLILSTMFIVIYFIYTFIPNVGCSVLISYFPSDCFVLLILLTMHYLQIAKPILFSLKMEKKLKKCDTSIEGLKSLLKDKNLLNEFILYCLDNCCIENVLFCKEYEKFKKYISQAKMPNNENSNVFLNRFSIDNYNIKSIAFDYLEKFSEKSFLISINETTSIQSGILLKDNENEILNDNFGKTKKNNAESTFSEVLQIITKIYEIFISTESLYAVNITSKTMKKLTNEIAELKKTYLLPNISMQPFNSNEKCVNIVENIFNDTYKEVLDNLFYNSYMMFIKFKKDEKKQMV
ncbi:hypothetical protein BCR36DRAFT_321519 [Piromyces finnis]|uniref:RGS domain-containing protein n=1 Tax=Piromyces finnis TaxID=1754191 RepID=A0A1Y1VG68_9FUNG|nr:hypothetical protein BCR36DRAFT_321519 [Piromyces finnis]|eukprot:ORX55417.1 hypothetical protein BCR36DRAFT_321519 [Piromyces finnis]